MHNAVVQFSLISIRSWWSSLVYYTVICTTFSNCSKTLNILTGGNCSQGILCSARHVMKPNSLLLLIICITLLLRSSSHGSRPHCMMHKGHYFLNCCRSEVVIGIVWLRSLNLNFRLSQTQAMQADKSVGLSDECSNNLANSVWNQCCLSEWQSSPSCPPGKPHTETLLPRQSPTRCSGAQVPQPPSSRSTKSISQPCLVHAIARSSHSTKIFLQVVWKSWDLAVCNGCSKKGPLHWELLCDFCPSFDMECLRTLSLTSDGFPGTKGCYWPSMVWSRCQEARLV